MAVSYNKLFKLLIDKKMKKKELCELAGVSISTIGKMGRGAPVSIEMVEKVCLALGCTADDAGAGCGLLAGSNQNYVEGYYDHGIRSVYYL